MFDGIAVLHQCMAQFECYPHPGKDHRGLIASKLWIHYRHGIGRRFLGAFVVVCHDNINTTFGRQGNGFAGIRTTVDANHQVGRGLLNGLADAFKRHAISFAVTAGNIERGLGAKTSQNQHE